MKFFTRFSPAPDAGIDFSGEKSLTQQSYKDDCDINVILTRFQEGPRPDSPMALRAPRLPMFGDFSDIPDARTYHYKLEAARASFEALPAELRARFGNNPIEMIAFVQNASAEQFRDVFGGGPVGSPAPAIDKAASVAQEVNSKTIAGQNP